ncbi:MAG: hypothetical protein EXR13_04555 [Candidatus Fonsibacter sp.]|nr:hypothetical protein [Candidatus Fonsibacter sp.]
MIRFISVILFFIMLVIPALANLPVKKTPRDICYPPDHPRYEKIKDYVKTYTTLAECLRSGGKTVERTS